MNWAAQVKASTTPFLVRALSISPPWDVVLLQTIGPDQSRQRIPLSAVSLFLASVIAMVKREGENCC
jgi:hypothetical protein